MPESTYISSASASRITLVSVSGLPDAKAAGWALALSQAQMPGCRALLCSPVRPADLAASAEHLEIAPLDYQGYSWFVLFMLWRVVHTEFALLVQDDGWVLDGSLWQDAFLGYDYIGAPVHLARVSSPEGHYWSRGFAWAHGLPEGHQAVPVLNGGFSLRSRRLMRAFADHPSLQVMVCAPDQVMDSPLKFAWSGDILNEDVQLTGVLRPQLEALGLTFAPMELASLFAIEYAGPQHRGMNALGIFGHHGRTRKLAALNPLTVRYPISRVDAQHMFGEAELAQMLEQRGYRVEYADPPARRRVYDCFTYNGEFEVLQIRLHELREVVDVFVIVEATCTFAGDAKALTLELAAPELAEFADRIRYVVVEDMPDDPPGLQAEDVECDWLNDPPKTGFWHREKYQRNQIMRGIGDAHPDDLILISDADEIPCADAVRYMLQQPPNQVFGLLLWLYYFYANYRNVEGAESRTVWSVAAPRHWFVQATPDQLRLGVRTGQVPAMHLQDAGWHFSYLGMSEARIRQKIAGFAHQEYNDAEFLAGVDVGAIIASGMDLYRRSGYLWEVVNESEAPAWMRSQKKMHSLFACADTSAQRYAKEAYIAVSPSPMGKWEHHPNRSILDAHASSIYGRVIDLGCNHGASTWWLTENPAVQEIVGVDINAEALAMAAKTFESVKLPHQFIKQDLTQGKAIEPAGDSLVSFHTLEHIFPEDVPPFLDAAYRSLKPGGHFVISIPYDHAYPDPCHVAFYTEKSLMRTLETAGFLTLECFKDDRFAEKNLLTGVFIRPAQ